MNDVINKLESHVARLLSALAHLSGRLLLVLVAVQFVIVVARYLLAVNFLWLQELLVYIHASIFMLAIAWGVVCNRHVRIDVFWSRFTKSGRRRLERVGTALLLMPMMVAIFITSAPYVVQSWVTLEGSPEISGLPGLFLLKTLLPVFALLLVLAGLLRLRRIGRE